MKVLFIADPMASFKTYKDTTYAMMREMAKRGWQLFHTLSGELSVQQGLVTAQAAPFEFLGAKSDDDHEWFKAADKVQTTLKDFDAVIMRTDPPFDMQYLYATQFLTLAEQQGAKVFNSGQAMRDFNEKLAILNFSQFTAPTLVTTRSADVRAFLKEHGDIIIKPLDGMGGMGIFRLTEKDPNIGSILETLMQLDSRTIMAQRYIPEIIHGDKRILIIGGEVVPYALARIPQNGAGIERTRPRNRRNPRPRTQTPRHLVGRFGRHRQQPDRSQRYQPDRFPRNHETKKLRRRRDVCRRCRSLV